MISEVSCDTEDWKFSFAIKGIKIYLKKKEEEKKITWNGNNISQY